MDTMMLVSNNEEQPQKRTGEWSRGRSMMVSVPIFIILIAVLVSVSSITAVPWNNEPTGQTIDTLTSDTAITFANTTGSSLPKQGDYKVSKSYVTINATRPSTGEVQRIRVLIRTPVGAAGARPGIVFMHGAGYGTCDNSFGDVATDLASAGFVTAVLDKPVWSTNDATRDYPASAIAYDQVVEYLRSLHNVNASKIGIYATSESTWISSYLLQRDRKIAFQMLLSPMVYSPRQSLGFLAAQDFALVGANSGYQSIVRRVFHADLAMFGLTNFDIRTLTPETYSVPTLVVYGSKDVMTAQVEGVQKILALAHKSGNWNMTIRSYPVANHVLRLGDEAESGTMLADAYMANLTEWAVGTADGLKQTSERVAGATIYQSIAVPLELKASRPLTVYGLILHVAMVVLLAVTAICWLVAIARKVWLMMHGRTGALGIAHGFSRALISLTITTLATLLLFAAGLGQVIMAVVQLGWGGAPEEDPGMMYWSWPVIQIVCTLVVWAWSRVLAKLLEAASIRGLVQIPPRKGAIRALVSGHEPVLATTRFGRVLFWITTAAMLHVLLMFAFWGMFIY